MHSTLKADGFDDAFIGFFERCGQPVVLVYDFEKVVEVLIKRDGMTRDDAEEYVQFNILGAWVGEGTPALLHRCTLKEAEERL